MRKRMIARGALAALVLLTALPETAQSEGMATNRKRALPAVPLPDGLVAPRVDFVDVAKSAGLFGAEPDRIDHPMTYLTETTGTGVALLDYDNDGLLDVFLVGTGRQADDTEGGPHQLYRNLGDLRFESVGGEVGLGSTGWGQGVCAGDFDSDGYTDLFVTHWGRNVLLQNVAGAEFRDVAPERGFEDSAPRWSTGCSFLDYDRDGDLDLFVAHYVDFDRDSTPLPGEAPQCEWNRVPIPCGPRGLAAESMSLFANDGSGAFRDVTEEAGVGTPKRHHGLAVATADFDADGWIDVFVACDSTANLLFLNQGGGKFEETGLLSGAAYNEDGQEQASMGVATADYNGDGRLDLFATNFAADTNTVYGNQGNGFFRDRTVPAGLATVTQYVGWGAEFLDYDRDGWPDLFAVNGHVAPSVDGADINETFAQPRLLFWNRGDGVFHPQSAEAGPGITAEMPSRGSATGDLDNDGDMEIVVVNLNRPPSLLQNQVEPTGRWLTVQALSATGGAAVGARVTVTAGDRRLIAEVRSGGSYLSQGDFRLHFGVGDAKAAMVEVAWPTGPKSITRDVETNQFVVLKEPAER